MNFFLRLLLLLLLGYVPAYGQLAKQVNSSVAIRTDSALWKNYSYAKSLPFWVDSLMPSKFSEVTLKYDFAKGNFIPIQGSTRNQNYNLNTEGTTKLKKLNLWGRFGFNRTREDSTRWANQTRNNTTVPYYFGSIAANNYYRTVYNLSVLASQAMLADNLPLSLAADYRLGNHYATNDPRGSMTDFQLNITPGIGYKIGRLQLNAGYLIGYGKESAQIAYKNRKYFESRVDTAYTNQFIKGYGTFDPQPTDRTYDNDIRRTGIKAALQFTTKQWGLLTGDVAYIDEKQNINRKNTATTGQGDTAYYYLSKFNARLGWFKNLSTDARINVVAIYENNNGFDKRLTYGVKNYTYNGDNKSVVITYSGNLGKSSRFNAQITSALNSETRQDGFQGNFVSYQHLFVQASWGMNHLVGNQRLLGWEVSGGLRKVQDQQLILTARDNLFTSYVIYHDYLYNSADALTYGANISYSSPVNQEIGLLLKAGLSYTDRQNAYQGYLPARSKPGDNRLSAQFSVNFYF